MYYDFRVPIPDAKGKIYPQERKGVTYIQYEYARIYNPDKKYNTPKRTTIGKVCEDDLSLMALTRMERFCIALMDTADRFGTK